MTEFIFNCSITALINARLIGYGCITEQQINEMIMRTILVIINFFLIILLNASCNVSSKNVSNDNLVVLTSNKEEPKTETQRLTICELLDEATRFDNKEVEITAILITGREYTYLYDPDCRVKKEKELWYRIKEHSVNEKLDLIVNPENPEYKQTGLIRVRADFTGTLVLKKDKGFGPDGYFLYNLEIRDIKNISSVTSDVPYPWEK